MSILTGSDILVTGGTGSFGAAFTRYALDILDPDGFHYTSDHNEEWYTIEQVTTILESDV